MIEPIEVLFHHTTKLIFRQEARYAKTDENGGTLSAPTSGRSGSTARHENSSHLTESRSIERDSQKRGSSDDGPRSTKRRKKAASGLISSDAEETSASLSPISQRNERQQSPTLKDRSIDRAPKSRPALIKGTIGAAAVKTRTSESESPLSDLPASETSDVEVESTDTIEPPGKRRVTSDADPKGDASESEMSVLIDDDPIPKSRERRKESSVLASKKSGKPQSTRPRASPNHPVLDPQEAEIKRLQSWLVKCGMRKLWHRELSSCETPKAKITHLKQMLNDVGLEGRFSIDKANRIRERRELLADVEDVQAVAKRWGKKEDSDTNEGEEGESENEDEEQAVAGSDHPRNRGQLDWLGSDDGEETS